MLVFLTNASTAQYRLDLLNVCCFSVGSEIAFDYRQCWIDETVYKKPDLSFWAEKDAIIIFYEACPEDKNHKLIDHSIPDRQLEPHGDLPKEFKFTPIRYAQVIEVDRNLSSYRFTIKLGDWYRFSDDQEKNSERIAAEQKRIEKHFKLRPRPGKQLKTNAKHEAGETHVAFVYYDDEDAICKKKPGDQNNEKRVEEWMQFVRYFRTVPGFDDCTFVWCRYFRGYEKHSDGLTELPLYRVKSGERDRLILLLSRGAKAEHIDPRIELGSDVATIIGPVRRQHGGGVELHYDIVFRDVSMAMSALGRIAVPRANSPASGTSFLAKSGRPGADVRGPEFQAELDIRPRYGGMIWAIIFFVMGTILAGVDSGMIYRLGLATSQPATGKSELIVLVPKLFAAICTGLGAFISLRRGFARLGKSTL